MQLNCTSEPENKVSDTCVVEQRPTFENEQQLASWNSCLQLTQNLKILQLEILAHVEDEDLVGHCCNCQLHIFRFTTRTTSAAKEHKLLISTAEHTE